MTGASRNPIANPGQFAAEAEVRDMWAQPETRAARAHAAQLWRIGYGSDVPPGIEDDFERAMDGWIGNYLFKAAAADPFAPRFVRNFMPPYLWRGEAVPDARMGGDNPDNCYRLAGIRHGCAYRVAGRAPSGAARPAHVSFTLVENWGTSITVQTVELPGIAVEADGRFTLTIDDQPAAGRPNHLTTNPRTKFLFVRDSMMDWARETPVDLSIERVDGSARAALSAPERLADALRRAREDVPLYYWFFRLSAGHEANSMPQPVRTASVGGLVTQASGIGRLHLADDQAAVFRFRRAGAGYNSLQLVKWWYSSIDAHRLQSGLSAAQAPADADGWITTVVSARDPGVANWVDTGGHRDLLPMIRWQGLPAGAGEDGPALALTVCPLAELERHLPPDTPTVDAAGRASQIATRRAAWDRRITP